jgi:hypothetical protein
MLEILGTAMYYEGQGNASLGMLRSLLEEMGNINGRKTLVLISAGMMASDVPGGRPDINELGMQVGKEAARSNTSIYTLYLDTSSVDRFSAEVRSGDKNLQSEARDSEVLGRWLDQFSGAAGGALFKVQVGTGEYAFDRIYKELSAYYLLGVEPAEADRDGRTHEIKVKTTQKNAIVRGRRWVTVPKRDGANSEGAPESGGTNPSAAAPAAASDRTASRSPGGRPTARSTRGRPTEAPRDARSAASTRPAPTSRGCGGRRSRRCGTPAWERRSRRRPRW